MSVLHGRLLVALTSCLLTAVTPLTSPVPDCSETHCTTYLIVDGSERINSNNFRTIKDALKEFVNQTISGRRSIRLGIIVYSDDARRRINASSDIDSLVKQIEDLDYPSSKKNTHSGIEEGRRLLLADPSSSHRVMVVITDGVSYQRNKTIQAAVEANEAGITMIAVGIDESLSPYKKFSYYQKYLEELENIASSHRLVYHADIFSGLTALLLNNISKHLCPFEYCSTCIYTTPEQSFFLNRTAIGGTFYTSDICSVDNLPLGEIKCLPDGLGGASWGQFNFDKACNFSDLPDSTVSHVLRNLSLTEVNHASVDDVIHSVLNVTLDTTLTPVDLLHIATIFEKANNVSEISPEVFEEILEVCDEVVETEAGSLLLAQKRGRASSRILETLDTIDDHVKLDASGRLRCATDTIGVEVWELTNTNVTRLPVGLQVIDSPSDTLLQNNIKSLFTGTDVGYSDIDTAIVLPNSVLIDTTKETNHSSIRLSMSIYNKPTLFSQNASDNLTTYFLNSHVISAQILVDGQHITYLHGEEVTIVFKPIVTLPDEDRRKFTVCGYWNFTGNDNTGSWSTDGCRYNGVKDGRDVCICNHLTNFAVLMDYYGQDKMDPKHSLSLTVITVIGLSLSIFGLSVTVVSIILFRKLRQTHAQKTLFNLALAQLCSWIVFLAGINQTGSHVGCIVVAALLHYFILASFLWMLAEGILYYLGCVMVLGTYTSRYMLKVGVPAWTIPLLPVIILLSIDTNLYRGGKTYCWMSLTAFYYAFALPVGLIILCNIVLYIMIVISVCRRSKFTVRNSEAESGRSHMNIRVSVLCFLLFGLAWVFGFLAISNARLVFQYIFCITNSVQGFLIFVFMTVQNKQVRQSWKALCCKWKKGPSQNNKPTYSAMPLTSSSSSYSDRKYTVSSDV